MKLKELKGKKILIVGRGIEGEASCRYLRKKFPRNTIDIVDKKDGKDYLKNQKNYDIAIKSPGVRYELINIPYTTPTNLFLANSKGKVIGVTGTKGKSTTSSLIYEMCKNQGFAVYIGGNIGEPSINFLDNLDAQSWTVLEMSSFQLQDVKTSPNIAVLLMIAPEHLNYHCSIEEYVSAKRNILRFQTSSDFAVINKDYPTSNESDVETAARIFQVSRERECSEGCFIKNNTIVIRKDGKDFEVCRTENVRLIGEHNLENACAASMAAYLAGVSIPNIRAILESFRGLRHRLEFVWEIDNIRFFNDSLATIPQATIGALDALPDTETLICGGFDRRLDYKELGVRIADAGVKNLILFPTTGERIWKEVMAATTILPEKFEVTTMKQAVGIAFSETTPGKIVLMSPASASFNLFKNYKDRGDQFKEEVLKLQNP
jgi:UDP-N-acetylmuramoylalanine--D-glutamate ligase